MTENDIKGNVSAIRELADRVAGADLPDGERQAVKMLCATSLLLLESLLLDINRSANALESIADTFANFQRNG